MLHVILVLYDSSYKGVRVNNRHKGEAVVSKRILRAYYKTSL